MSLDLRTDAARASREPYDEHDQGGDARKAPQQPTVGHEPVSEEPVQQPTNPFEGFGSFTV